MRAVALMTVVLVVSGVGSGPSLVGESSGGASGSPGHTVVTQIPLSGVDDVAARELSGVPVVESGPTAEPSIASTARTSTPPLEPEALSAAPEAAGPTVAAEAAPGAEPQPDVLTGEVTTPAFSVLGFTWDSGTDDASIRYRVRESGEWSGWQEIAAGDATADGASPEASARPGTDPVVVKNGDGIQVWADSPSGTISGLRASVVDPGVFASDAAGSVAAASVSAPGQPSVVTRAGWGADESLRTCEPDYSAAMRAVAVHHTASANGYSAEEVPALIRGFYAYHVQSRGWCDIGYNFLVDRFGRIFEGRAGGMTSTVVGVHTGGFNSRTIGIAAIGDYSATPVPAALTDALVSLIAWKAAIHHIVAGDQVTMVSGGGASVYPEGAVVSFPTIYGHRDAQSTACPGQYLYDLLPTIRARVAQVANASIAAAPTGVWEGLSVTSTALSVSGWVLDPGSTAPLGVDVRLDGAVTTVAANLARSDVGSAYPAAGSEHGFAATFAVGPGRHVVCIEPRRLDGSGIILLGCKVVSVVNRAPIGAVDVLKVVGTTLTVAGWTLDPDSDESTSVHVYIGSRGVVVPADLPRPDVAAAYGRGANHGFALTTTVAEGNPTVCVYAIDSAGGAPTTLRCSELRVGSPPVGVIESVGVSGSTVLVSGWAFDPDTAGPT
ncbi:MAG: peptidoglycan recognition protein, partial [Cellulomonas sp.]|nr:peptidoglycan recognition protein [Cellulomonas sp.]